MWFEMDFSVIFGIINIILLLLLLFVYVQNYRQMKSPFILGLILFALIFLVENVLGVYFHFMMVDYYSAEAMENARILMAVQTVALAILTWVTWRE